MIQLLLGIRTSGWLAACIFELKKLVKQSDKFKKACWLLTYQTMTELSPAMQV